MFLNFEYFQISNLLLFTESHCKQQTWIVVANEASKAEGLFRSCILVFFQFFVDFVDVISDNMERNAILLIFYLITILCVRYISHATVQLTKAKDLDLVFISNKHALVIEFKSISKAFSPPLTESHVFYLQVNSRTE